MRMKIALVISLNLNSQMCLSCHVTTSKCLFLRGKNYHNMYGEIMVAKSELVDNVVLLKLTRFRFIIKYVKPLESILINFYYSFTLTLTIKIVSPGCRCNKYLG